MVTEFFGLVFVFADACAQRGDQRGDGFGRDQFVKTRAFDVEHLAAQRQDSLELAVAPLFGRATGGVTFDDIQLALRRVFFLAVGELAGQADAIEHAFTARHVACLAGCFPGAGCFDNLAADGLSVNRLFKQKFGKLGGHNFFHRWTGFRGNQLHLRLRGEFRIRHLHREHAGKAFAHVVTSDIDLCLLGNFVFVDVFVDHTRHCCAQTGEVGAAI